MCSNVRYCSDSSESWIAAAISKLALWPPLKAFGSMPGSGISIGLSRRPERW